MRYAANAGGEAKFDLMNGMASVTYAAEAKLSVMEAGAEMNFYLPDSNGWSFEFKVPVERECFEPTLLVPEDSDHGQDPMFALDSAFYYPQLP